LPDQAPRSPSSRRRSLGLEPLSPRAKALLALGLAAIAFVFGAAGQAVINRDVGDRASWLGSLADPLRGIYVYPQSVLFGAILLALGGLVFALAASSSGETEENEPPRPAAPREWLLAGFSFWLVALAAGIGLWLFLNARLAADRYEEYYPHLLLASLVLVGAALLVWDRRLKTSLSLRIEWREVAFVAAVIGLFVGLNVRDLDGWRYSAIGDEYAFFGVANEIASGQARNLFDASGVYAYRPVGGSALHALSMELFGADIFGWKMSNVLLISAALPLLYLLTRQLFHRWAALTATGVLGFSHHVFAYTHIGYDNLQVVLFSVAPLALFIGGLKRQSVLLLFAAGAAAGATAYTYPGARVVPIVMGLYLLSLGWRHWKPQVWLPLALGGVMTVLPMLVVSGDAFWTNMNERSVFGFTDSDTEGVARRILENIPRTLFIFNHNPGLNDHYVSGSLLEPVGAVFYAMGLAVTIARFRQNAYRFVLIWLGLALITAGILSPYNRTAEDRMHLAMPAVAVVTGIGVYDMLRLLAATSLAPPGVSWAQRHAPAFVLGALLPVMLVFNSLRFWVDTPNNTPTSVESVVARAVFSDQCERRAKPTVVISIEPVPLLMPLFQSYKLDPGEAPVLLSFRQALERPALDPDACFVLSHITEPDAQTIRSWLAESYPAKEPVTLRDLSGVREVLVYY
jgi:hypothetical protein